MAAIHIGISGWRYAPWRGDFYPKGLTQKNELKFASRAVSSIEINGSFYSLQRPELYSAWYAETPAGFVFYTNYGSAKAEQIAGEPRVSLLFPWNELDRQVIKHKERFNPEVPLIAMQEQADEFNIQKAMKSGACDLVSLGNKDRLQAVVSRELRALRVERALNSTIHSPAASASGVFR